MRLCYVFWMLFLDALYSCIRRRQKSVFRARDFSMYNLGQLKNHQNKPPRDKLSTTWENITYMPTTDNSIMYMGDINPNMINYTRLCHRHL